MKKISIEPTTLLYPVPATMVSCSNLKGEDNIIAIAWIGTVCSNPPMLSISVRPERYSFNMIMETKEFVVNIPDEKLVYETDFCGTKSGRDIDKFNELNLTKVKGTRVNAPLIKECPINLECKVKIVENLGTHYIFIAEIVAVHISENIIADNKINLTEAKLVSYIRGNYYKTGEVINLHGFSIKKQSNK